MMQQDFPGVVWSGGWLASANYFGYLLGALPAVALRVRAGTATRAGRLVIAVVTGMGLIRSFGAWLVLRALAGVGRAWVFVSGSAWALGQLSAAGRPLLRGTLFAGIGTGIAVAGAICVALMQGGAGVARPWRHVQWR